LFLHTLDGTQGKNLMEWCRMMELSVWIQENMNEVAVLKLVEEAVRESLENHK